MEDIEKQFISGLVNDMGSIISKTNPDSRKKETGLSFDKVLNLAKQIKNNPSQPNIKLPVNSGSNDFAPLPITEDLIKSAGMDTLSTPNHVNSYNTTMLANKPLSSVSSHNPMQLEFDFENEKDKLFRLVDYLVSLTNQNQGQIRELGEKIDKLQTTIDSLTLAE